MTTEHDDHFVADGYSRARSGNYDTIRAEVQREYAERRQSAGLLRRWFLYFEMHREIERRLDRVAPPWGLYFTS
jgi:hypothetical protein